MKEPFALSDAIRIGAAIRPQGFNYLFYDGKSCAKGAAIEALTGEYCEPVCSPADEQRARLDVLEGRLAERYREILECDVPCPVCAEAFSYVTTSTELGDVIEHLNDTHRWRRKAIADFVAQVEEQIGYETITVEEQSNSLSSSVVGV